MDELFTDREKQALHELHRDSDDNNGREVRSIDLLSAEHHVWTLLPSVDKVALRFGERIAHLLSRDLRRVCSTTPSQVELLPTSIVSTMVGTCRYLYSVSVNNILGQGFVAIDGLIGNAYVVRQFGGDLEDVIASDASPTQTERRTVSRLAGGILDIFAAETAPLLTLSASIDDDGEAELPQSHHPCLVIAVSVACGSITGKIVIGIDSAADCFRHTSEADKPAQKQPSAAMTRAVRGVPVLVRSVLGTTSYTVRDLLAMRPGDVIALNSTAKGDTELLIEGYPKLVGRVYLEEGRFSLKITGVSPEVHDD